jgi:O-antigen/teichoic acid export membrane protein
MTSNSNNNKRIAKNTLMLYIRTLLTMVVSLYTVRVVLDVLGQVDYGVYQAIAGVVTFFAFLSNSMAQASQRFLSFAIGQDDTERLHKTFANTQIIYLLIAVILVVLLETVGTYFVYNHLLVPPERVEAVRWVFHFAVFSFMASISVAPYTAAILAHEDMHVYAYLSIADAVLKLVAVFLLTFFSWDKLKLYSVLTLGMTLIIALVFVFYCRVRYRECKSGLSLDKALIKEMLGFTGWSVFGSFTVMMSGQAVTILLNQFFNPVVVAARAIAMQISSVVSSFSANFNGSLTPPIVKSYAQNDLEHFYSLILKGTKITYYLMLIIVLPIFYALPQILTLWLKNPPQDTVLFVRLTLIKALIDSVSYPIMASARATGKVRVYELSLGSILLLDFVICWLAVRLGAAAFSVFVVAIGAATLMFFVRFAIVRHLTGLSFRKFLKTTIIPAFFVTLLSVTASYLFVDYFSQGLIPTILAMSTIVAITGALIYFIGINRTEKAMVNNFVRKSIML